jgi:glycosyltransferase involved in cell wall biosynthesis
VVIDLVPTRNPYLNGLFLTLRTVLGRYASNLEPLLRRELISEGDRVIFHVHDPYLLPLAVKLSRKFPRSRIVYDRHEYYETWKNRLGFSAPGLLEGRYGKKVSEVVFVSRSHSSFPKALANKPVSVVPNYPLSKHFDREAVLEKIAATGDGDLVAVYFGVLNLNFDRDLRSMFKVMGLVMEAYPRLRFEVAGRVYDDEVRSIIDELKARFGERVSYLGEIPYKEVIERTQRAHLGFFLLRPDSQMWSDQRPVSPNKIYEYLLSGTIPVVRAALDDREAIERCSLVFGKESGNDDVRQGILDLINDRERMKRMMRQCFDAGKEYSWEKVAVRYEECYERLFDSMA